MQEKIDKVCFVFRDINKDNSSSQPLESSLDVNQGTESTPLLKE